MPNDIGLDVHKNNCQYAVLDEDNDVADEGRIPSTPEALIDLAEQHTFDTLILEASSVHEWAYDVLTEHGVRVFACHPGSLPPKASRRKKTDRIDARQLVKLYRGGVLTEAWVPDRATRQLRRLARSRVALAQDRTRMRNRIHARLNRDGVTIQDEGTVLSGSQLFTKNGQALVLEHEPDLARWYRMQDALTTELATLDERIEALTTEHEAARHVRELVGFGPVASLAFVAELGTPDRFDRAEEVVAYFGLDPTIEQSGDTVKRGGISKRGPAYARGLFTQAAWVHVTRCADSHVTKAYQRLAKRIGKQKAIVAATRKLVKVAFCMLRDDHPFDPAGA